MGDRSRPSQAVDVAVFGGMNNGFGNGDLTAELANAKAALLYADHVWVQTYRSVFLLARMTSQVRTVKTRFGSYVDGLTADERELLLSSINHEIKRRASAGQEDAARTVEPFQRLIESGMTLEDLLDLPDLVYELASQGRPPNFDSAPFFHGLAEMAVQKWVEFKPGERPISAVKAIEDLNYLHDRGLLSVDPGDPSPMWSTDTEQIGSIMFAMIEHLVDTVSSTSSIVNPLIEGTASDSAELTDRWRSIEESMVAGPSGTAIATQLLLSLPDFSNVPVDELVDLRQVVSPSLARFRSAMADFQEMLDADESPAKRFQDRVEELRLRVIEPELEELRETLGDSGVIPTVARGVPLTASGAVRLGVSAAVGGPLLAGLTAVAAGVSTAVAQEVLRRRNSQSDRRKHRLFLLWQADEAARGWSKSQA